MRTDCSVQFLEQIPETNMATKSPEEMSLSPLEIEQGTQPMNAIRDVHSKEARRTLAHFPTLS
jgi:hypothetical protein